MKTKRFRKWCAIFIPTLVIIFFFAGFLFAPNDPMKSNLLERYADPSAEYPFGTDALGRCILSRILYGGWTTLGIVLGGSLIVFLLGTVIGMVTSRAVMKENALIDGLINAVTAIPPIAYLIVFIGAWGSGAKTTLVALTVSYILRYIKLVRTRTDMEMGKAYVMCAIASGASAGSDCTHDIGFSHFHVGTGTNQFYVSQNVRHSERDKSSFRSAAPGSNKHN